MAIWNRLISVLDKTVLQWVFPPMCIHCKEPTEQNHHFCNECLELIDNCFLYREDTQLCEHLGGEVLCIAFENMGPLYTLAHESHPIYKKLFIEFVKLVYLQSNLFGCDGIVYCDRGINTTSLGYVAKNVALGLSLPVYKINTIQRRLYLPLLLYWQFPSQKEHKKVENILSQKIVKNKKILILFDQFI